MARTKNIYVIDTCVLLHDPECIFKFEEHDIYIPLACIDDLDEQKIKRDNIGWAAREVFRILDQFDIQQLTKGVVVNDLGGKMFIYNNEAPLMRNEKPNIQRVNSDNAIIDAASSLRAAYPKKKIIIVSKDTGLRVRANSWGCVAENYKSDLLSDSDLFKGYRIVQIDSNDDWEVLLRKKSCDFSKLQCAKQLEKVHPNEFLCFRFGNQSILAWNHYSGLVFLDDKLKKDSYMGITAKNMEQKFAIEALADDSIPLVCLSGPAGSGKSLLSVAVALEKVYMGQYDKMIIMKPMVAVGGKDIGYLPGDKLEKISVWLGPFKDNIVQLTGFGGYNKQPGTSFEELIDNNTIEVEALTFIQGRSITNSVIIVDESQNISPREARMVVERSAKNSKVILLGDLSQIENPYLDKHSCGLAHAINGGKAYDVAASVMLTKVERSILSGAASGIFKTKK